jgi:thiaminase/transcriptional activator TenA
MTIRDHSDRLAFDRGLFGRLRRDAGADWTRYVDHAFVRELADGGLAESAFRRFLTQDYLFLIQFARAYALAGYKSATLAGLRAASAGIVAILDTEMPLHIAYCARWGLSETDMAAEPEALETVAYTRFVLDRGMAGDRLDLEVALAPCVIGYAEIGERLIREQKAGLFANPYAEWIRTYGGADYQSVAGGAMDFLERLGTERGAEARYDDLLATFRAATQLETAFWSMALAAERQTESYPSPR